MEKIQNPRSKGVLKNLMENRYNQQTRCGCKLFLHEHTLHFSWTLPNSLRKTAPVHTLSTLLLLQVFFLKSLLLCKLTYSEIAVFFSLKEIQRAVSTGHLSWRVFTAGWKTRKSNIYAIYCTFSWDTCLYFKWKHSWIFTNIWNSIIERNSTRINLTAIWKASFSELFSSASVPFRLKT